MGRLWQGEPWHWTLWESVLELEKDLEPEAPWTDLPPGEGGEIGEVRRENVPRMFPNKVSTLSGEEDQVGSI